MVLHGFARYHGVIKRYLKGCACFNACFKALEEAEEAELMMTDLSDRHGVASALLAQAQAFDFEVWAALEVHSMEGSHAKASSLKKKAFVKKKTL